MRRRHPVLPLESLQHLLLAHHPLQLPLHLQQLQLHLPHQQRLMQLPQLLLLQLRSQPQLLLPRHCRRQHAYHQQEQTQLRQLCSQTLLLLLLPLHCQRRHLHHQLKQHSPLPPLLQQIRLQPLPPLLLGDLQLLPHHQQKPH
jgi:hypothetical protein